MVKIYEYIEFVTKYNIKTRPYAGPGFWLMFLLPMSLIISNLKYYTSPITSDTYRLSSLFSLGLVCTNCIFLRSNSLGGTFFLFAAATWSALLFKAFFLKAWLFCIWSALLSTIFYQKLYEFVLRKLPNCFTLGEAAICTQSFIFLLYHTGINIERSLRSSPTSVMQISTLIIQLGLMGLALMMYVCYKFDIRKPAKFYTTLMFIVVVFILLPLHILLETSPLLWIIEQMVFDLFRSQVVLYWCVCSVIAGFLVNWKILKATKASTSVRKVFHILAVAVFIPGLLYNCSFLYLSSGVVLGIFFALELLRILDMPPLGQVLQDGLLVWSDEKDAGIIALTPIYLLAGCALPLWIHPGPCDLNHSALLNLLPLLSGILTVGIGDTAASIIGSKFGKHKWRNSKKSVEGTIAMIISQGIALNILQYFGFLVMSDFTAVKTVAAIVITSMIEAKTDQVDNLTLPFVMYLILV